MSIDVHLKTRLEEADAKYGGDEMFRLLGPTLLSWTNTDSGRMYMFTSHLKQVLCLDNPDIPRLATGFENDIGRYSNAYKQLQGTWEVKDIIRKFSKGDIYTIILYNKKTDTYDMIEKKLAESLTEKFGYVYNTSFMDNLKIGDKITDPILYKSTSFDAHMNYRYGKNARVHYAASTDTLEDAIVIRRSWAESVKTVEVDDIQVSINANDIPLNLYGSGDEYRAFPDLGEHVKNSVICATRKFNKAHLLYDFQKQNMREIKTTDTEYYSPKDAEVYDINIFYNGDEAFPETLFYGQLKTYYDEICIYADKVYSWAKKIKKSGSKYTKNVTFLKSKYDHFNDPEYKWKNKDKAFGNIIVEFKVKASLGLDAGSKLSSRYGDKGVISRIADDVVDTAKESIVNMFTGLSDEEKEKLAKDIMIVDDDRMPYTDDGPIDISLNLSGSIRR